jgi:hyaluronan synthase
VPHIRFRYHIVWPLTLALMMLSAAVVWRCSNGVSQVLRASLVVTLPLLALRAYGWVVSAFDRPHKVRPGSADDRYLAGLRVVISVPCKDEDAVLLDRCLWALFNQTRTPQRIDVVNDGSVFEDYTEVREYWTSLTGYPTVVTWHDQENMGKRRAHTHTFVDDGEADVFGTVDSDTTLCLNALEEGLKPFADRRVQSVAGIELGYNARTNMWTVLQNSLQQVAQVVVSAAWSVSGRMFTNRGPFALYRGGLIRGIVPLYWSETFFGKRVILGDDSLLAMAASMHGRAVQQLSAFGLTMWPEDFSHHIRQRLRWARGRTIRNFWRLKYYPFFSYLWWFTFASVYSFFASCYLLFVLAAHWPHTEHLTLRILLAAVLLGWISQFRVLALHRDDDSWIDRALLIAIRPVASVWASVVLTRIIRAAGMATCLRQGWTTRKQGAELRLILSEENV